MAAWIHRFRSRATGLTVAGLNLLFPPRCAFCEVELPQSPDGFQLCTDCRLLLGPESWPGCPRCAAAGQAEANPARGCPRCRETHLKFDTVTTLGGYKADLRDAVLRMKTPRSESLSAAVGRLLASRRGLQLSQLDVDLVVPIPMYWSRKLKRGTNNPEILAASLGEFLGVPVSRKVLSRCRNTLPQINLTPKQRKYSPNPSYAFCERVRSCHACSNY